jgi:G3E family GTPase
MEPLPVTVIGGYLGAGKTTLVNHLLRHAAGRRLAVLVNEFGELAIDEDLIEAEEDGLISIAGGCICCSFGNDLIGALHDLAAMSPPPDQIMIESSGVAIPGAIVSTMLLTANFRSDGVVVVIDAETVQRNARDDYIGDTITRQLADSEVIVANKIDLLDEAAREALMVWIASVAPGAIVITATRGEVAPDALLGVVSNPGPGHPSDHSDQLFESMVVSPRPGCDVAVLAERLALGPYGVIRTKGYARGPDGALKLLHTVGQRWEVTPATDNHDIGIICLGFRGSLDKSAIAGLVAHLAKTTEHRVNLT